MVAVGMKYIASVSFGKDSLAMLLRLLEENYPLDAVIFYNTGMEFQSIYDIRDRVRPMLDDRGIALIELHPKEPFLYSMTERKVTSKQKGEHLGYGWCGGLCRWGTRCKIDTIKKFKRSLDDDVTDYVGIAYDEQERFEKEKSQEKCFPLVDWRMTEADCLAYCWAKGWHWKEQSPVAGEIDLYNILSRVSCWCCSNKNLKELRSIYQLLPQYWDRLRELQKKIDRPFKGWYKGAARGIFELEERFQREVENGSCKDLSRK